MSEIAYVNGVFGPLADAKVSIEDRGFQFADGIYEVVVAPSGRPFRLDDHITRFRRSAEGIGLAVDFTALNLPAVIAEGIQRSGFKDALVYIQITRGAAARDHVFPEKIKPTVVATFKAKPVIAPAVRERGVTLMTTRDIRWERCYIKSVALLANVLMKNEARRLGCHDAIIVSDEGIVRETTCANVFFVKAGRLVTSPASDHILHGVTRAYLLECAASLKIPVDERDFTVPEMLSADEVFITSTTQDVLPASIIDGHTIGAGRCGPISEKLNACFQHGMLVAK
jgi:D-alanine transaminase